MRIFLDGSRRGVHAALQREFIGIKIVSNESGQKKFLLNLF
jgi:hypothetical protein